MCKSARLETSLAAIPYKRMRVTIATMSSALFAGARRTTIGVCYKRIHLSREEHKFGAGPAALILRLSTC